MPLQRDRRQFGRRMDRVLGWIIADGRERIPCRITNISPGGAMLELEPPSWLPFRFQVLMDGSSAPIGCEVRHVAKHGLGVVFTRNDLEKRSPLDAPSIDEQQLWINDGKRPASKSRRPGNTR